MPSYSCCCDYNDKYSSSIGVEGTVPNDPYEISQFKDILIQGYSSFLPVETTVTNLDLVVIGGGNNDIQSRRALATLEAQFQTQTIVTCTDIGTNACDEDVNSHRE